MSGLMSDNVITPLRDGDVLNNSAKDRRTEP